MYYTTATPDQQSQHAPTSDGASPCSGPVNDEVDSQDTFIPVAPGSLQETGMTSGQVESLILKFLLNAGTATGREIAGQIAIPFPIIEPLLRDLKAQLLVVYKGPRERFRFVGEELSS